MHLPEGILPVTIDQGTANEHTAMIKMLAHNLGSEDPDAEVPLEEPAAAGRLSDLVSPEALAGRYLGRRMTVTFHAGCTSAQSAMCRPG